MLKLDCNNLSKKEYQKYLSELFFNNEDYVQELSDYAYFRFTDWVDFIFSKYSLDKVLEINSSKNYLIFMYYRALIDTLRKETFENKEFVLNDLTNVCFCKTNMFLNYDCELGKNLDIYNCAKFSICASRIGNNCEIFNNVIVNKNNQELLIMDNVKLKQNCVVVGGVTLNNNSVVNEFCVVTDDLSDYEEAKIVNQVQTTSTKNKINTKKIEIYGVVPKFKNSFVIIGEGFYNPTVLIKLKNQNKELRYEVDYWDKNKIIIKIKNTSPLSKSVVKGLKIIILSNDEKVVILNNFAVEKCLLSLKN